MIDAFLPPSKTHSAAFGLLRRALPAVLGIAIVAGPGPAQAQGRAGSETAPAERRGPLDIAVADPDEVVAAEQAFARAVQEKGQWTAFAEYAGSDAVMFVPQAVKARDWLAGRADPPQGVRWQPHDVWMSCDGSLAVTRGGWQRPDGSVGYFTTVWALGEDQDGYRWILDQGDTLEQPLSAPTAVRETVGDCPFTGSSGMSESDLANLDAEALRAGAATVGSGWSADGTLAYRYSVKSSGAREFAVLIVKGGRVEEVIHNEVAAP
jgi:hypothetical protein